MNYHCDGMRLQVVTISQFRHIMKSVVDLKDSLVIFQKPNKNQDKQPTSAIKKKVVIVSAPSNASP